MENRVRLFQRRYMEDEEAVDNCLHLLENAIKAIEGGLNEKDLQKVCKDSLNSIKEAKDCRLQTKLDLNEWDKQNYEKRQERIAYHHKHSRFKQEANNDR